MKDALTLAAGFVFGLCVTAFVLDHSAPAGVVAGALGILGAMRILRRI